MKNICSVQKAIVLPALSDDAKTIKTLCAQSGVNEVNREDVKSADRISIDSEIEQMGGVAAILKDLSCFRIEP
jgi:hypothetical protein